MIQLKQQNLPGFNKQTYFRFRPLGGMEKGLGVPVEDLTERDAGGCAWASKFSGRGRRRSAGGGDTS